ncbi:MAG: ABC-type transport auxiliary lipoprotein family protein [Pseudomonadota bacterium]
MATGLRAALLCLLTWLLAGCALMSAGQNQSEPVATFDLAAVSVTGSQGSSGAGEGIQLIVQEPTALRSLAADRMLIKPQPELISFFPSAVWNDRLPRLIQARIVQSLQTSPAFDAVSDGRDRLTADLELAIHLTAFHVVLTGRAGQRADGTPAPRRGEARLEMQAKLISVASGRVIEQRRFAATQPVGQDDANEAAGALNEIFAQTLIGIANWLDDAALALQSARAAASIERPSRAARLRTRRASPPPAAAPALQASR